MRFGFDLSEFLKIVSLAHKTYENCCNSATHFKDIGRDVGNTHIILKTIATFWQDEESRGKPLLLDEQEQLRQYSEDCESVLTKLEQVTSRYGHVGTAEARLHFTWKDFLEDFARIRETLRRCTSNLATFHIVLTQDALLRGQADGDDHISRLHKDVANILEILIRTYISFQNGEKEEPAFSQVSRGSTIDRNKVYESANEELGQSGISHKAISDNQPLVKEWIDTVVLAEAITDSEDGQTDAGTAIWFDEYNAVTRKPVPSRQTTTKENDVGPIEVAQVPGALVLALDQTHSISSKNHDRTFNNGISNKGTTATTALPDKEDAVKTPGLTTNSKIADTVANNTTATTTNDATGESLFWEGLKVFDDTMTIDRHASSFEYVSTNPVPHSTELFEVLETATTQTELAHILNKVFDSYDWAGQSSILLDEAFVACRTILGRVKMLIYPRTVEEVLQKIGNEKSNDGILINRDEFITFICDSMNECWRWHKMHLDLQILDKIWRLLFNEARADMESVSDFQLWKVDKSRWTYKYGRRGETSRTPLDLNINNALIVLKHLSMQYPRSKEVVHATDPRNASSRSPKLELEDLISVCKWNSAIFEEETSTMLSFLTSHIDGEARKATHVPLLMHARLSKWPLAELAAVRQALWGCVIIRARLLTSIAIVQTEANRGAIVARWSMLELLESIRGQRAQLAELRGKIDRLKLDINELRDPLSAFYEGCANQTASYLELQITAVKEQHKPSQTVRPVSRQRASNLFSVDMLHVEAVFPNRDDNAYTIYVRVGGSTVINIQKKLPIKHDMSKKWITPSNEVMQNEDAVFVEVLVKRTVVFGLSKSVKRCEWTLGEVLDRAANCDYFTLSRSIRSFSIGVMLGFLCKRRYDGEVPTMSESLSRLSARILNPTYSTLPRYPVAPGWKCIKVPFLGQDPSRRVCFWEIATRRPTLVLWQEELSTSSSTLSKPNEYGHHEVVDMGKVHPLGFTTNYGWEHPKQRREALEKCGRGHLTYKDLEYWV